MTYNLRARKPPRRDALLAACHDVLPREILEYILHESECAIACKMHLATLTATTNIHHYPYNLGTAKGHGHYHTNTVTGLATVNMIE